MDSKLGDSGQLLLQRFGAFEFRLFGFRVLGFRLFGFGVVGLDLGF